MVERGLRVKPQCFYVCSLQPENNKRHPALLKYYSNILT